jgi:hypothetical protein
MKAAALPEAVLLAVNELEAAATKRSTIEAAARLSARRTAGMERSLAELRLQKARVALAAIINAECARQFEAGLEAARAENLKPR